MGNRYDTYGIAGTLEDVAARMQQLLGVQLEERDSSYYAGTYYLYRKDPDGLLRLYNNYDSMEGEWIREQYREHALMLEVSCLDDMDGIQQKLMGGLEGVVLLRSETLPDAPDDEE